MATKAQLAEDLAEMVKRKRENRARYYIPYTKQKEFHFAGVKFRERLFMAGNQLGKTYSGAMEAAFHLTGDYPEWWEGRRFLAPTRGWALGVTNEATRDNPQRLLMGLADHSGNNVKFGTGAIPKKAIVSFQMARGMADAVDTVQIRHKSGGISTLSFKSYERGRQKLQGESLDFVWADEEPDSDVYAELLARITARQGMLFMTFTPLLGMSEVVRRFLSEENTSRHVTRMEIQDAEHIPESERQAIIDGYPEHEREARAKGIPVLGSGRVFPVSESAIEEDGVKILPHWASIVGMDFGWGHPTAAVWMAHDRDTDTIHIYDCYRQKEEIPAIHAATIKAKGDWIPVAWPHDGLQHDKGSGVQLAEQYKKLGLKMLHTKAEFEDGTNGVEAGVMLMLERMRTGRLKVAKHLHQWWEEFRMYHRKDGIIVKERDDLMAATRYGIMMIRQAQTKQEVKKWDGPLPYPNLYLC